VTDREPAPTPDGSAPGPAGRPRPVGTGPFRKIVTLEAALTMFRDGDTLLFGGFGSIGTPPLLVDGLAARGLRDLTVIGNDSGYPSHGIGKLIARRQVRRAVVSHIGSNPVAIEQMNDGTLEVEFVPQGTLAERIRAGGAGLGGILTDVGEGTEADVAAQHVEVAGRRYAVEAAIRAPLGIVLAELGDPFGNLVFRGTARNFNPLVAMAADVVVAEVRKLVPEGELDPDTIHTPGIFVDYVLGGSPRPTEVPRPRT
jgi:acetate CoA/acetoacetate CoA-transferase alpha subunit